MTVRVCVYERLEKNTTGASGKKKTGSVISDHPCIANLILVAVHNKSQVRMCQHVKTCSSVLLS